MVTKFKRQKRKYILKLLYFTSQTHCPQDITEATSLVRTIGLFWYGNCYVTIAFPFVTLLICPYKENNLDTSVSITQRWFLQMKMVSIFNN